MSTQPERNYVDELPSEQAVHDFLQSHPDFFERHLPDLTTPTGTAIHVDNLDGAGSILPDGSALSAGPRVGATDAIDIVPRAFAVQLDLDASSPVSVEAREVLSGVVANARAVPSTPGASAASVRLDVTGFLDQAAVGLMRPLLVLEVDAGALQCRASSPGNAGQGDQRQHTCEDQFFHWVTLSGTGLVWSIFV